ncbi:MAG: hypothetical protein ACOX7H_05360, partial [Bacillota bacterium]
DYYSLGNPSVSLPKNYCDMIKTAIYDELNAAALYERLAAKLFCLKQKEIICSILNDEKHHARILAAMYQRCTKTFSENNPFNRGHFYHNPLKGSINSMNPNPINTLNPMNGNKPYGYY